MIKHNVRRERPPLSSVAASTALHDSKNDDDDTRARPHHETGGPPTHNTVDSGVHDDMRKENHQTGRNVLDSETDKVVEMRKLQYLL